MHFFHNSLCGEFETGRALNATRRRADFNGVVAAGCDPGAAGGIETGEIRRREPELNKLHFSGLQHSGVDGAAQHNADRVAGLLVGRQANRIASPCCRQLAISIGPTMFKTTMTFLLLP